MPVRPPHIPMYGDLPRYGQSTAKASYDPLQPDDEQLRLYDAGAYKTFMGYNVHALPTSLRLLRAIVNFPGAVFFPAYSPDSFKTLPRTGPINWSGLKKFVWYTRHGLGFTLLPYFTVSFCGCFSWILGHALLSRFEPYKTFVGPHPRDHDISLAPALLGSGILGTTIGLVFFLLFGRASRRAVIKFKAVKAARWKSRFTWCSVVLSFILAPIIGVFAGAVGVALAPASMRPPEPYTAIHALAPGFCGSIPLLMYLTLIPYE